MFSDTTLLIISILITFVFVGGMLLEFHPRSYRRRPIHPPSYPRIVGHDGVEGEFVTVQTSATQYVSMYKEDAAALGIPDDTQTER